MDPISIIASAITIGASAAQLSLALSSVVGTLKNAPKEIADIADEISLLAGSLQTLGEILGTHQNLCKPAFFANTRAIISRYEGVAAEIRLLISRRRSLVRLKWLSNKIKVKGLLKKIEGIKTLLVLELSVIRLAREEANRPSANFDSNGQSHGRPGFNRFRRIVESAVQAGRHVVESAQEEDEKLEAGTEPHSSAELDLWKSASSDTAPWLFQMVFSSGDTSPPPPYPQRRQLHQASVVDESVETATRSSHTSSSEPVTLPERRPSSPDEKAMILWSRQTEPDLVVNRLLSSWTTLSPNQISLSSTRQHGVEGVVEDDTWREDILRKVEEAKKDDDVSLDEWEQENEPVGSDDEAFQSAEEDSTFDANAPPYNFRRNTQQARTRSARTSDRNTEDYYAYGSSPIYNDPPSPRRKAGDQHVKFGKTSTTRPRRRGSKERKPGVKLPRAEAGSRRPSSRVRTIRSDQTDVAFSAPNHDWVNVHDPQKEPRSGYSNPFRPGHTQPPVDYGYYPGLRETSHVPLPSEPPRQAHASNPYLQHPPGHQPVFESPPPSPAQAQAPPMPFMMGPPPPPPPPPPPSDEAGGDGLLARLEKLLEKRNPEPSVGYEDPPFSRLAKILQEREVQSERGRANAATEVYMKQMQDVHEKDEEKMKQLESLVALQRAEQKRMEVMWDEERKAMEARAAEQAQQVKDLAAKEISAAQLAKEAAQAALNAEKLEAEKKARKRADAMVIAERQRSDEVHKLQVERYEELLRGIQEQQLSSEQDNDQTIRRTRIAEGNRSVDVTEYATSRRAPLTASSSTPFLESFARLDMRPNYRDRPQRNSRRDSFRSSISSMHASRTSLGSTGTLESNSPSQQMIVFPVKADRRSQRMDRLQKSLAGFGIESVFEDAEDDPFHTSQLIQYNYDNTDDQIVRSTIFWESSALNLGSELLLTMRQAGWRTPYTRISGKGQTHYLGSQPIHTYFFDPDYEPQFCPSEIASGKESITIQKALVEEYALIELGFQFQTNDMGLYILDGRLTYNDIETVIERSFLMRENNYRRLHRQLQWHFDKDPEVPLSAYPAAYASSAHSAPSVYSGENSTVCDDTDAETRGKKSPSSAGSDADQSDIGDVSKFLVPRSEASRRSAAPSSAASRTSKSTNPYRKYMNAGEDSGVDSVSRSSRSPSHFD